MRNINEFNLGDMVEMHYQLRKPKLKGIIIQKLGFDENLDDFIYMVYCFSFKPPRKIKWTHRSIKKI